MSVQEIEQAIAKLFPDEVDEIADWLNSFRESSGMTSTLNGTSKKQPQLWQKHLALC